MKYFRCTVCGYIHHGEEPPDICPVCKAPKEKFEELPEEEGKKAKEEYDAKMEKTKAKKEAAQKSKQDKAESEGESEGGSDKGDDKEEGKDDDAGFLGVLGELISKNHLHPITVHFPNGVLPVTVLFLLASLVSSIFGFSTASLLNLGVVALAMPVVLFTGYVDWQRKYKGYLSSIFKQKIGAAVVVALLCWILTAWGFLHTAVYESRGIDFWAFLALHLVMLGAAGFAGHIGGKLVFKD